MAVHLCLRTPALVLVSDCKVDHPACASQFVGIESQLKHVKSNLSGAGFLHRTHVLFLLKAGIISYPIIPSSFRSSPEAKKLLLRPCAVLYRAFCSQQLVSDGLCCLQVSDQCVKLVKAGWFDVQKEPSGVSTLTNPNVRPQAVPNPSS